MITHRMTTGVQKIQKQSQSAKFIFMSALLARLILLSSGAITFHALSFPGTDRLLLVISTACGLGLGAKALKSNLSVRGLFSLVIPTVLLFALLFSFTGSLDGLLSAEHSFLFYRISEHISICFIVFLLSALSTFLFFKSTLFVSLEFMLFIFSSAYLLSGHRGLKLDSPRVVSNLAWTFGISQITGLVITGIVLVIGSALYLNAGFWARTLHGTSRVPQLDESGKSTRKGIITHAVFLAFLFCVISLIALAIRNYYRFYTESRLTNGVSESSQQENDTPLNFHSGLGGSNQPSALVRLDEDYPDNPFAPMLYLREAALSKMLHNTLAVAGPSYDRETPRTSFTQSYLREENPRLVERKRLSHSVYMIADFHKVFAVDYPISIVPIKNPEPKRFKAAWKATSLVPSYPASRIENAQVGNADWDDSTWKHYTKTHPDKRYAKKAKKITSGIEGKVAQASAIVKWLNNQATYTLSPGHEVAKGDDPVAPFLFGDLRGYCVHFAHATVYMLRALGIPSRIATGYLTDLADSRDGHILLRMSDRHAWAEVYVSERGWIPFDVQPSQVESHADSEVDLELLEKLMSMLEPDETILPEDILEEEPNIVPKDPFADNFIFKVIILLASLIILFIIGIKLYLRYSWALQKSPEKRIAHSYRSLLVRLYDRGLIRNSGETRIEFEKRICPYYFKKDSFMLTSSLLEKNYNSDRFSSSLSEIDRARKRDIALIAQGSRWEKIKGILNPSSALGFLGRVQW